MTISSAVTVSGPYLTDGVTNVWDGQFRVIDGSHVEIMRENISTGAIAYVAPTSVAGVGSSVTQATYPASPLAVGYRIYVRRKVPYTQLTKFGNEASYYPKKHENAYDLTAMQILQARREAAEATTALQVLLTAAINAETTARVAADAAEAAAREMADTLEATTRGSADIALSNRIDAVEDAIEDIEAGELANFLIPAKNDPAIKSTVAKWLNPAGEYDFNLRFFGPENLCAGADITAKLILAMAELITLPLANRTILFSADDYTISAPIISTTAGGAISFKGQGSGAGGTKFICAATTPTGETRMAFDMRHSGCRFSGIQFVSTTSPIAIRFKKTSNADDVDAHVKGCEFLNFSETAIDHFGRGLTLIDNDFAACNRAARMQWPSAAEDAAWAAAVDATGDQALPTGYRAFRLVNNRGHSMTRMWETTGENSQYWSGIVALNEMDLGRSFWIGGCCNTLFADNDVKECTTNIIAITSGGQGNRFLGGQYCGESASPSLRAIDYGVNCVPKDVVIGGDITFRRFSSVPISFATNAENVSIKANFRDWARGVASSGAIQFLGNCADPDIDCDFGLGMEAGFTAKNGGALVQITGNLTGAGRIRGKCSDVTLPIWAVGGTVSADCFLQGDRPWKVRGKFGVQAVTGAELWIEATKNGSWSTGDPFGRLVWKTGDADGGGAGDAAYIEAQANNATGAASRLAFGVSNTSSHGILFGYMDAGGIYPPADNSRGVGTATARFATGYIVSIVTTTITATTAILTNLDVTSLPGPYANDAAAGTGGVAAGRAFRRTDGVLAFKL